MKQYIMVIATALLVAAGCTRKQRVATLPKPPKLVMFIVIDQFPYEYITRFSPYFEKDGFQKLMDGGAYFTNCSYRQATTQTSVGHSVMMSGLDPSEHGITANYWYDRATQRKTYSCEDTSVSLIGMPTKSKYDGRSPHHFTGSNLADQLRFHTGFQSKVFGVSNKDRSAILMAGKRPNAAYWYNEAYGGVITSTYYMDAVPPGFLTTTRGSPMTDGRGKPGRPF